MHVKAQFKKEAKELVLVPYQAAILALFNDAAELSIGDMMERTNLEEADVVRSVSSMAHAKHHVLKRKAAADAEGKAKKSKPGKADVYFVNLDFTDKLRRCARSSACQGRMRSCDAVDACLQAWTGSLKPATQRITDFSPHSCSAPSRSPWHTHT